MPLIRKGPVLAYFSHIPKCGGTSVIKHFSRIKDVSIGFYDERHMTLKSDDQWGLSSPQHIDGCSAARLLPADIINSFSAITRHPISRCLSAFYHQKFTEQTIEKTTGINEFIKYILPTMYLTRGWMDNHFLPQNLLLYPGVEHYLFKLEEKGHDLIKEHLQSTLNIGSTQPMPHENITLYRQQSSTLSDSDKISAHSQNILIKLYKLDFKLLKYDND